MKKLALVLAICLLACAACGCGAKEETVTLNVLNWGDYIEESLLDQFEAETGIHVNYTTMASNEEMIIKLTSPDCVYDLCFPSDYIIEKLVAQDLLYELNKDNIPNLANIDERFLDLSFDPGNRYSVPYMWGTVGILYNTEMVDEPVESWDILWDEKYAGQIIMYDSMRDSIGVALIKCGHDINTRNADEVEEAAQALIAQKPLVQAYLDDAIKTRMITDSAALSVVYSGDAILAVDENDKLDYVVPKEGSNVWFDNVVIPRSSQHTAEAEAFINFLCDAEVGRINTEYIGYSTPNKAALALMDEEWTENPIYNPPQEDLDRCTIYQDLGDFVEVFSDAWTRVKAS